MKKYKHTEKKKATERASFYVALSVCLMAVAMAVWSAYSALSEGLVDGGSYSSSLSSGVAAAAQDMSGVTEASTDGGAVSDPSQIPTESQTEAQTETEPMEKTRSFQLSETKPAATEPEESQDALSAMQAVLKVDESLVYPVKSRKVTKEYSDTAVYNNTMKDYRVHSGCDFAAEEGENVYAMSSGTVIDISVSELYGVIVEVDCGDYTVYYCGLDSEFSVDKGDEVSVGDTIGTVGHIPSESADGSHIHIEVRVGDRLIDPLSVIDSDN